MTVTGWGVVPNYIYYFPDGWAVSVLPSDGQARTLWKSPGCTWNQRWTIHMEWTQKSIKHRASRYSGFFRVRSVGSVGDVLDKKTSSQPRMNKITGAGMNQFLKEHLGHIFWVWTIQYTNVEVNIEWHPCMVYDNINLYTNIYPNTKPNVGNYLLCIHYYTLVLHTHSIHVWYIYLQLP